MSLLFKVLILTNGVFHVQYIETTIQVGTCGKRDCSVAATASTETDGTVERRMRPQISHDSLQEPRRRPIPNLSLAQPYQFHRETQLGQFSHIQAFPVGFLRRGPCRLQDYRRPMNVYKDSQFSYVEQPHTSIHESLAYC